MNLSMPQSRKLPSWLSRLLSSKPKHMAQPRCSCGRFCSNHEKPQQKVDPILAERIALGQSVPAYFAEHPERLQGGAQ